MQVYLPYTVVLPSTIRLGMLPGTVLRTFMLVPVVVVKNWLMEKDGCDDEESDEHKQDRF